MTYATLASYTAFIADIAPTLNDVYSDYLADPTGCHEAAGWVGHRNNRSWLMEYVDHYATGAAHIVVVPEHVDDFAATVSRRVEEHLDTFNAPELHALLAIVVAITASVPAPKPRLEVISGQ